MGEERCGGCRFWSMWRDDEQPPVARDDMEATMGFCHRGLRHVQRRLRTINEMEQVDAWQWPSHMIGDWCGEYQPRKPLPVVS